MLAKVVCKPGKQRTESWVLGCPLREVEAGLVFLWISSPVAAYQEPGHLDFGGGQSQLQCAQVGPDLAQYSDHW